MLQSCGLALNLTRPAPLLPESRAIVALLRGPAAAPTLFLASNDFPRFNTWYTAALENFPEPSDAQKNEFGMLESGQFSVDVLAPSEGAPYVDVADNKAVSLDGVDDKLVAPSSATLNFGTGSFTVVARIKHRDFAYPKTMSPFGKISPAGWNLGSGWGIGAGYSAAALYVFMHDGTTFAGGNIALDDGFRPPQLLNKFADIAVIFDRTAGVNAARIIVNGVMQSGSLDLSPLTGSVNNVNPFEVGTSVGWLLDGVVDEIQAWSRALSVYELVAARRKRLKGNETGLAMLLRCDEGAGLTAFDATANANNATLTNGPTWTTGAPLDALDQFFRLPGLLKNVAVDLDLHTRVKRTDGTETDFINERRGVVKGIVRKRGKITLDVTDVDRAARGVQFPIGTYITADYPNLYDQHVNRAIAQGVGLCEWLECSLVDIPTFKYAVCEIPAGFADPVIAAVYRGSEFGKGAVVAATEYATSTATVSGRKMLYLTFTREQLDGSQYYVIGVKITQPGSRLAADEHARLSQLIGLTIDAADYADAAAYHAVANCRVDAWYTRQVAADAWLNKIEMVGRMWVSQQVGGSYSVFVDRPRDAIRALWDAADPITVDERREPEVEKTITLRYRPRPWDSAKTWGGDLPRLTSGASGEKIIENEFIYDHEVADRLHCYLVAKALRPQVKATIQGLHLTPGELIAVNSPLILDGWKRLAAASISRPMDGNDVTFLEYSEADYVYTVAPGGLPADAVASAAPDYSYTPPIAPTNCAAVSGGINPEVDGKASAWHLLRGRLPAFNASELWVTVTNAVTNAENTFECRTVNGLDLETKVPGLQPNVAHTAIFFCKNKNGLNGVAAATVNFTAVTYTGAPAAPTSPGIAQTGADQLQVYFTPTSGSVIKEYIPYVQVGAGAFTAQAPIASTPYTHRIGTFGVALTFKFRAVDRFGNQSADSATTTLTPSSYLSDYHVTPLGIGTGSLAALGVTGAKIGTGEVYQNKLKSTNTSTTYTVAAGGNTNFYWGTFACGQWIASANQFDFSIHPGVTGAPFSAALCARNNAGVSRDVTFGFYQIEL